MDDSYPDWKAHKVKLESELDLDHAIETEAHFSDCFMDDDRQNSTKTASSVHLEEGSVFHQEPMSIKTENNFAEENDIAEQKPPQLDFMKTDEMRVDGCFGPTSVMPLAFVDCSARIKEEVTTDLYNCAPYLEASDDVSSTTLSEQNQAPPERITLNLAYGLPSIPKPVASTSQDVTDLAVKIKEEIMDDVSPSPDASMDSGQHFSTETDFSPAFEGSSVFPRETINIKVEDGLGEECVVSKENGQLDFPKSEKEMEVKEQSSQLSKRKQDLASESVCYSPSVSVSACNSIKCTKGTAENNTELLCNEKPSSSNQCTEPCSSNSYSMALNAASSQKKQFPCDQCSAQFTLKNSLKQHLLIHSNEKAFSCDQCSARFKQKGNLLNHLLTHSNEKRFSCDQCSAQFKLKGNLKQHMLIHSNKRPFPCDQCSARFNHMSHLKNHVLTHTKEKSFSCNQCPAHFSQKGHLTRHLSMHSNEKAFSCEQCSALFRQKGHLKTHLLIHTNEKPFTCNQCPAQFRQRSNLKEHLLIHSNERAFSCDKCSASFKRKSDLGSHSFIHSNAKEFFCEECSAWFKRNCDLRRHLSTHSHKKAFSCDQ